MNFTETKDFFVTLASTPLWVHGGDMLLPHDEAEGARHRKLPTWGYHFCPHGTESQNIKLN